MRLTSKQVPLDQVQLFQWETLPPRDAPRERDRHMNGVDG